MDWKIVKAMLDKVRFWRCLLSSRLVLIGFALWLCMPAGTYGQSSATSPQFTTRPKVDASTTHGIYLTAQGTIMAWGSNSGAAFCGGSAQAPKGGASLQEIPGIAGVADIAVGLHLTFLIMRDGSVIACGNNDAGQAGVGGLGVPEDYYNRRMLVATPTPVTGLRSPKQIAIGDTFVIALLDDGRVMGWGTGGHGVLGNVAASNPAVPGIVSFPRLIPGISGVREIAAGRTFTLALMKDGTVKGWGWQTCGELGSEKGGTFTEAVTIPQLSGVRQIAIAERSAAALLEDGTVRVWGNGHLGMVWSRAGDRSALDRCFTQPVKIPGLSQVKALYGGLDGTNFIAVLQDGSVRMWGYNGFYQQGIGNNEEYPLRLASPRVKGVMSAVSAGNGTYLLLENGRLLNAGIHHGRPRDDSLKVPTEIWPSYPPAPSLRGADVVPAPRTGVAIPGAPLPFKKLSDDDDYNEAVRKGDVLFEKGDYFEAVRHYERAWRIAYNRKLKVDSKELDDRLARAREARDKKK